MTSLPCLTLNKHAQDRAKKRHPWVFSNELSDPKRFAQLEPGTFMDVLDHRGDYLGTGFVNPHSLIAVRILSRKRGEAIDLAFLRVRIEAALERRDPLYGKQTDAKGTYRAVFGEADGLPGLVIDRFEGGWVVEPHAKGMELRREDIFAALESLARERYQETEVNIFYRTDHRAAQLEKMEVVSEVARGRLPAAGLWAAEGGVRLPVDPLQGQKTGFFFDQRDNREFFARWVKGKAAVEKNLQVLDLFCHAGAWGLRALQAGAQKATFVDSSAAALESVKKAAKALGVLERVQCLEGDASVILRDLPAQSFGAISLDPPALVPNKKSLPQGTKLYRDLNRDSMRLVAPGGVLSTSSCSYHLQEERFEETVLRALLESGREATVLRKGGLSADHPVLPSMEEGRYLKNVFLAF